jgi:hypothetical protein
VYESLGPEVASELAARGHLVQVVTRPLWAPTALSIDSATGSFRAAGDPRTGRHAAAISN